MNPIITCEHASNRVPPSYAWLFEPRRSILRTHSAYDIGAARVAREISHRLSAPLFLGNFTRLLVDLNRSENNRTVFSSFTSDRARSDKEKLLALYHRPYQQAVRTQVEQILKGGDEVFHLSVHSFTPVLEGTVRKLNIGLLYDPSRSREKAWCVEVKRNLKEHGFRVRLNYPYRGTADGLITSFRKQFPKKRYMGVELEINQRIIERIDVGVLVECFGIK